jgi:phospholipase C
MNATASRWRDNTVMPTRRDFFQTVAGGAGWMAALMSSIEKASAIEADPGSSYLDAEHIVILMQENRSFDHAYGTLRGVRGFNDPRAVTLPNENPVWLQSNAKGETYAPFRLDMKNTKATWLGSLPHGWRDQLEARNHGNHDQWLDWKPSGRKECAGMPFTMGYYNRQDIPFYYALADAFTICDQNFCSSLSGTTPNRLHLWTGTIREKQSPDDYAHVRNSEVDYPAMQHWKTFPERLEDAGVSWKIYQNEINLPTGMTKDEDGWLSNFSDNPIEWFTQFHGRFSPTYRRHIAKQVETLPAEIAGLEGKADSPKLKKELETKKAALVAAKRDLALYTAEAFAQLPQRERNLFNKAFTTNVNDPHYRELKTLRYKDDNGVEREMTVPKGDILHQFRADVKSGQLPAVSWLVPPELFSDHPGAPWYGAWYLAEALDILTQNPNVWKKTIFVLAYDENDGYFDHVPPFVVPDPARPETGKTSPGIDASNEYNKLESDLSRNKPADARGGPIGLGYRVPLVIASPWSRGGYVCSQVFDHTSVLQLAERVLSHRTGKDIRESNISQWRRQVCGDLSSAFRSPRQDAMKPVVFPDRAHFLENIHKAQFKPMIGGFTSKFQSQQERGTRPSLPLPYDLHAHAQLGADKKQLEVVLESRKSGCPFHAYTPGTYKKQVQLRTRAYAVAAGEKLQDAWSMDGFENDRYHLRVCGPNGFLREFQGDLNDPPVVVLCTYVGGDVELRIQSEKALTFSITDHSYKSAARTISVPAGGRNSVAMRLKKSASWYDFSVASGNYSRRFAGRVETGQVGISDPAMA